MSNLFFDDNVTIDSLELSEDWKEKSYRLQALLGMPEKEYIRAMAILGLVKLSDNLGLPVPNVIREIAEYTKEYLRNQLTKKGGSQENEGMLS